MRFSVICNCHDLKLTLNGLFCADVPLRTYCLSLSLSLSLNLKAAVMNKLTYVSFHKVG